MKKYLKGVVFGASFLILLLLRFLRPFIRVRLMIIGFHKFGHLALEPDLALLKIDDEKKKKAHRLPLDCYLWSLGPKHLRANRVLAELWGQRIRVIPSWLIDGFVRVGRTIPALELEVPKHSIHGPANRQISTPPPLHLSQQQEKVAKAAILEMGLNPNQPFVCLIVRDSGHNADPSGVENPGYEFRNFDIDVFSDAAIALSKRGYQVVRMGAGKEKAFSLKHEGVFDYATSIHRTELLDIYLAANCAFAISTQTGPDAVCLLFRRPVCFVDIPLFSQFFFGTGLAFWNPTVYSQRGRKLSLREIIDADLLWEKSTEELLAKQIEGVRSTPIEIQQNVMGFVEMYESGFVLTKQQEIVLDEANLIISSGMGLEGETVFGQIQARFNPPFLTRNAEWFLR